MQADTIILKIQQTSSLPLNSKASIQIIIHVNTRLFEVVQKGSAPANRHLEPLFFF